MSEFPHLPLPKKIYGNYKHRGFPRSTPERTKENIKNRRQHGEQLLQAINKVSSEWEERREKDPSVFSFQNGIPLHLKLDTSQFPIDSLSSIGVEVVAEDEDGTIIGASLDNFASFRQKIDEFLEEKGRSKDRAARIWDVDPDTEEWKVAKTLSEELQQKWQAIDEDQLFTVEVGIACHIKVPEIDPKSDDETDEKYNSRYQRWLERKKKIEIKRTEVEWERQNNLEDFLAHYDGTLLSGFVGSFDSFCCKIQISGKGLKDLIMNHPFVFEVVECDEISETEQSSVSLQVKAIDVLAPTENSAKVCVIDSGIQEGHRLLSKAIDSSTSRSFITNDPTTADVVANGGHGTRVTGAILFPKLIPDSGSYQLPCFIQNARVLVKKCLGSEMPKEILPAELMQDIVQHFSEAKTKIFNMSITSNVPCRTVHMSSWAESIDNLMQSRDVLFILPTGNVSAGSMSDRNPCIKQHITSGKEYPHYLLERSCRIADPAQSSFALTVGSICTDKYSDDFVRSFGGKDDPSPFSRTGLGMWGMIKPDVVEYGGDLTMDHGEVPNIVKESPLSPELVRSTSDGGSEVGNDTVGTSYSAPRVARIVALLQKEFPDQSVNLYRALIVQSARLPKHYFNQPDLGSIRHYGYGIPDEDRALNNAKNRISYIASDKAKARQANVYSIKVPEDIRGPGEDYQVLVEVTLAYMAKPRRTRQKTNSYLSKWLSWESSKLHETIDEFQKRVLKNTEEVKSSEDERDLVSWFIRENKGWGIGEIRRQDSTLQKSWCFIEANKLPETLCFAVVGHDGWDKDPEEEVPYSIVVSFESQDASIDIYNKIRLENEVESRVEIEQEIDF